MELTYSTNVLKEVNAARRSLMFRNVAKISEKIIPNAKTSVVLEKCKQALNRSDFNEARSIFNQIPLKEREVKIVKGMFARIENEERLAQYKKALFHRLK